jgi:hypothetical protein
MEWWSVGVVERGNDGVVECGSIGVMEREIKTGAEAILTETAGVFSNFPIFHHSNIPLFHLSRNYD